MQNGRITAVGGRRDGNSLRRQGDRRNRNDGLSRPHRFRNPPGPDGNFRRAHDQRSRSRLSDEIMPHMHVYDAFHAETALIPVTASMASPTPSSRRPAGTPSRPGFLHPTGRRFRHGDADGARHRHAAELHRRATPQPESSSKRKFPYTRMGMATQLRQAFIDAQDYDQKLADYDKKKTDAIRDKKHERPRSSQARSEAGGACCRICTAKKPVVLAAEKPQRPGHGAAPGQRVPPEVYSESRHPLAPRAGYVAA